MRVCEVTPYGLAQVSGVTRVVVDLAGGIGKRGHHVSIIAPSPSPSSSSGEYDVWPVKLAGPFRNVRFSRAVASLLLRRKADWDLLPVHQAHPASIAAAEVPPGLGRPLLAPVPASAR